MIQDKSAVLYIGSDRINLALLQLLFRKKLSDLTLLETDDTFKGIEIAHTHKLALIMVDIQFPVANNYDILSILKSCPDTAAIPIWAISACAFNEEIAKGIQAGFNRYITKPIDLKTFIQRIRMDIAI
ncbi:response regulator [Paenibacillus wulumuqiensis]|uniref:response regulator n=1 Tax=Paenibacillus wulumuqiensis TaxID=1567107 RepID=UPI000619BD0F|nr:response regulator [Paenibacillus wulumuqiensis]